MGENRTETATNH